MATTRIDPEDLLPLTPAVFHVLLALADGERHGYAIMQEVKESTKGRIKMGPGTLYGTIKRLLEARMIEESHRRPDPELDDERRRYYRLTGIGQRAVKAEALRYAAITEIARRKRLIRKPVAGGSRFVGVSISIYWRFIQRSIAANTVPLWRSSSATSVGMPGAVDAGG